ncbi:MAG: hypothetical protein JW723_15570 [Bacteroidales bacterium]|nr:hypothetical protein [Bacteroidales bacterium]
MLITIGFHLKKINGPFFFRSVDPEYIFLFSGISLAHLRIDLFIDQPGTPLQLLIAVTAKVLHLFRPGNTLLEDAMQNPELYLQVTHIVIILIVSLLTFTAGHIIYRKTGILSAGIFLQFSPFIAQPVFTILERIMPEPLFIPLILLLISYLIMDINDKLPQNRILRHKSIIYGVICGLCLSLKFTFIPFIILPLFLISKMKEKVKYILSLFVSFYLFTFPLFIKTKTFYNWIKSLFIHSGKYGSGRSNFIDLQYFMDNLKEMSHLIQYFFITIFLCILVIMICRIPAMNKKINNKKYLNVLTGVTLVMILSILLIAKHYASHYLIPVLMLTLFAYYLIVQIAKMVFSIHGKVTETLCYLFIIILFSLSPVSFQQYREHNHIRQQVCAEKSEIVRFLDHNNINSPMIISSDGWNVKKELGLWFGKVMTPKNQFFTPVLNRLYPDFYFYKESWKNFLDWNNTQLDLKSILEKHEQINIIISKNDEKIRSELIRIFESREDYKLNLLYYNENLHVYIYNYHKIQV